MSAASLHGAAEQRQSIMVVEDDRDIRESLRRLLEEEGFAAPGFPDGQCALDALRGATADRPELVVLDLMMPVMDGWEFRAQQRADPGLADIPVLAISASTSSKALAVQADAYLRKPFRADDFLREVTRVLLASEHRRMRQGLAQAQRLGGLDLGAGGAFLAELVAGAERGRPGARGRLMAARAIEQREPLRLADLVIMALRMTEGQTVGRARLVCELGDDAIVSGDGTQLVQVFVILLLRAAAALSADRAATNLVRIILRRQGGHAVVEVADNGAALPSLVRGRLFEPPPGDELESEPQLGLGLYREIVVAHGGTIEVESDAAGGNVFRVLLPVL
jgi:CheY-like chemotaxis protein